jgi:hypothetical protein
LTPTAQAERLALLHHHGQSHALENRYSASVQNVQNRQKLFFDL